MIIKGTISFFFLLSGLMAFGQQKIASTDMQHYTTAHTATPKYTPAVNSRQSAGNITHAADPVSNSTRSTSTSHQKKNFHKNVSSKTDKTTVASKPQIDLKSVPSDPNPLFKKPVSLAEVTCHQNDMGSLLRSINNDERSSPQPTLLGRMPEIMKYHTFLPNNVLMEMQYRGTQMEFTFKF